MKIITDIYIFKTSDDIKIYKALWDTGATETLISNKVDTELSLEKTGEIEVSTINGVINTKRYECGLLIENHSKSINIQPAEFSYRKECDIIIGMDVIQHGLFILNKGKFSFTIEQLK
jgi:predicted aspartyl protease